MVILSTYVTPKYYLSLSEKLETELVRKVSDILQSGEEFVWNLRTHSHPRVLKQNSFILLSRSDFVMLCLKNQHVVCYPDYEMCVDS